MGFYELSKEERIKLVDKINKDIADDMSEGSVNRILRYFSDDDTYIRKVSYQAIGRIYKSNKDLKPTIIEMLRKLFHSDIAKVRQTVINAAGEIGMIDFESIQDLFNAGLFDHHQQVHRSGWNGWLGCRYRPALSGDP